MELNVKPIIKQTLINYFDPPEDECVKVLLADDAGLFEYVIEKMKLEADELRKLRLSLGHMLDDPTYERAISIIVYAQLLLAAIEDK